MPDHVLKNDDIHGQCISTKGSPRITILHRNAICNFGIEVERNENMPEGTFCTDFVIRNVTAACRYRCVAFDSHETKYVAIAGM